jgi:hypothetical protein
MRDIEAVEIGRLRKLMRYGQADFEEDWNVALALAVLMATGRNAEKLEPMLNICMNRILAYLGNNPNARPFVRLP